MIYYPLSILMLAGIREILVISTPEDTPRFEELLGDGSDFGIDLKYAVQPKPEGLAQAFLIAEDFLAGDPCCMVLGDNIFYGHQLTQTLEKAVSRIDSEGGAQIFGYYVEDPERYGVAEFDESGKVLSIEEKPQHPKSSYAVVGLYFYDQNVVSHAKELRPSARGELEITDLNNRYLKAEKLHCQTMGRGFAWLDTGTHDSLLEAGQFVELIEKRQGLKIACLEEIAFRKSFISAEKLSSLGSRLQKNQYGQYLIKVARGELR